MPAGLGDQEELSPLRTTHHRGQRDVLVPLRVGRLLQDLAAELGHTEDWGMGLCVESELCGDHPPPH